MKWETMDPNVSSCHLLCWCSAEVGASLTIFSKPPLTMYRLRLWHSWSRSLTLLLTWGIRVRIITRLVMLCKNFSPNMFLNILSWVWKWTCTCIKICAVLWSWNLQIWLWRWGKICHCNKENHLEEHRLNMEKNIFLCDSLFDFSSDFYCCYMLKYFWFIPNYDSSWISTLIVKFFPENKSFSRIKSTSVLLKLRSWSWGSGAKKEWNKTNVSCSWKKRVKEGNQKTVNESDCNEDEVSPTETDTEMSDYKSSLRNEVLTVLTEWNRLVRLVALSPANCVLAWEVSGDLAGADDVTLRGGS